MSKLAAFFDSKDFAKMLAKGKEQTFLSPEDINDAIPAKMVDTLIIDEILMKLDEADIEIKSLDREDDDRQTEEGINLDKADQELSLEEKKELKSASTDPVKLYLKKMGSVALLTREGEVEIAKEIEEGEKEIVLSTLYSSHALAEIIKLKEKIVNTEDTATYVKELVRGLDENSTNKDIEKVKKTIFVLSDELEILLQEIVEEDGTFKKLSKEQEEHRQNIGEKLVELTEKSLIVLLSPLRNITSNSPNSMSNKIVFLNSWKLIL